MQHLRRRVHILAMSYLTRPEVECAQAVASQYDDIDETVMLAEMEDPRWWQNSPCNWAYSAAHTICATLARGETP